MFKKIILSTFVFFISTSNLIFTPALSSNSNTFTFKKQSEIQHIKPKKPVKIKLKRLANGSYTWDLTGGDLKEIIRIDKELRKQLNLD